MDVAEVQAASIPLCSTGSTGVPHDGRTLFLGLATENSWLGSRLSMLKSFIGSLRKHRFKHSINESLLAEEQTRGKTPVSDENDPEGNLNEYFSKSPHPPTEDPFKTPPRTPTKSVTANNSSPLSLVTNSPDSTSTNTSFDRKQRARLMSRVKSVQILGVEASTAVAEKWLEGLGLT